MLNAIDQLVDVAHHDVCVSLKCDTRCTVSICK